MKKTMITLGAAVVLSGVGMVANADTSMAATSSPFYITAGVGYVSNSLSDDVINKVPFGETGATSDAAGVYSKLGAGYNFNQYFGIEGDWYHLPSISVTSKDSTTNNVLYSSANKLALLAKVMYPIANNVRLVGAAGIGYDMYKTGGQDVAIDTTSPAAKANTNYNRVVPMIQGGIEYAASQNVGLTFNVNYSFKSAQIPSQVGGDFGVNFHF